MRLLWLATTASGASTPAKFGDGAVSEVATITCSQLHEALREATTNATGGIAALGSKTALYSITLSVSESVTTTGISSAANLLLEAGDRLLLETGDKLLLEAA